IDPWLYFPEFGDRSYGKRGDNSQEKMDQVYENVRARFASSPSVVFHRSAAEEAVTEFQDGYFDFIYIDGNHSYDFVKKDIEMYLPKAKNGGYVTGDDYVFDRCPQGGPKRAV